MVIHQINLYIQSNSNKISRGFFTEFDKLILQLTQKSKWLRIAKTIKKMNKKKGSSYQTSRHIHLQ